MQVLGAIAILLLAREFLLWFFGFNGLEKKLDELIKAIRDLSKLT